MNSISAPDQIKHSVRALLTGAIDYAGLFPPAGLSMIDAVINYAAYRNSNYSWMLGRFIVPAARLGEFYECAREFAPRESEKGWRLSVIVADDIVETIHMIKDFNAANGPDVVCDTLEIKADSAGVIENTAASMPGDVVAYFEIPLRETLPDLIATLALTGQRAKIRTGGVTPESIPGTGDVIRFVRTCLAANVRFKATAGLHHPVRCFRPLTYDADSPMGTMHGFLNLFLMTGFAREGYRPSLLAGIMEDEFEEVFKFEEQSAVWRDEHVLSTWQLERIRMFGIQSFGSCSFDEPIEDLQKLSIL
jgi:hypothetical protein